MNTTNSLEFYHNLNAYPDLDAVFADFRPQQIPDDWVVYISDVVGSTKAIEAGQYKDVNTAGSLPTMALANLLKSMNFPFIFGGDGMTAVLPRLYDAEVRLILGRTASLVQELFNLDLRVGAVGVAELTKRNAPLYIAKIKVSKGYMQALLWGDGMGLAEEMVKGRDGEAITRGSKTPNPWLIERARGGASVSELADSTDFRGFSCRWQPIPSHLGQTISILVQPVGNLPENTLKQMLAAIRGIIGSDEMSHPINIQNQRLNRNSRVVELEAQVTGYNRHARNRVTRGIDNFFRRLMIRLTIAGAYFIIRLQIPGVSFNGHAARLTREQNRANADVRKVDGMLKMVVACTPQQGKALEQLLAAARVRGEIRYGIHCSTQALMTCFVHDESGNEVHFVDADGGGYALAAKMLKAQIAEDA